MTPEVVGRYAPSPTGPLHLGNVRTALLAWLQARLSGGRFLMRMEDLDRPRVVDGSAEQILDDLAWLGLHWDGDVMWQSARDEAYEQALAELESSERVFRCWCSRRDIAEAVSAPHGSTPVYPGTCRDLTADQIAAVRRRKPDRIAAWRYRVHETNVTMQDEVAGPYTQDLVGDVGDFVLRRADGLFAYQLAVVVDDIAMQITDVVRGADLLESTPRQIALYRALGVEPPRFWHVPLMLDAGGQRMSKRDGSQSVAELRAAGWTPARVVGLLATSLGWISHGVSISAEDLAATIDLTSLRQSGP